MQIYFAPLQGITDGVFRKIHADHFPGVAKYFMPFISPTQNYNLTNKELREIDPGNLHVPAVPQIIASHPELFLWAANQLADLGYDEVNLNAGCPSGTVTAKGKGAGMLLSMTKLELFLDEVYGKCPIRVSIKTRLGWTSKDEYPRLVELLNQYPVSELIVHGRTRAQFYEGEADPGTVIDSLAMCRMPVVYNGDLFTPQMCKAFMDSNPQFHGVMVGRGHVANPALVRTVLSGEALTRAEMQQYHAAVYEGYMQVFPKSAVLGRMREIGKHLALCFEDAGKIVKKMRKASSLAAYDAAVCELFEHDIASDPGFRVPL